MENRQLQSRKKVEYLGATTSLWTKLVGISPASTRNKVTGIKRTKLSIGSATVFGVK